MFKEFFLCVYVKLISVVTTDKKKEFWLENFLCVVYFVCVYTFT